MEIYRVYILTSLPLACIYFLKKFENITWITDYIFSMYRSTRGAVHRKKVCLFSIFISIDTTYFIVLNKKFPWRFIPLMIILRQIISCTLNHHNWTTICLPACHIYFSVFFVSCSTCFLHDFRRAERNLRRCGKRLCDLFLWLNRNSFVCTFYT